VSDRSRLRLVVLQVLVVSLLLTLVGRLWFLQIYSGEVYRNQAANNQVRHVLTQAVRGQILDDEGRSLVRNRTALVISVDRSVLDQMTLANEQAVLIALAAKLGTTPQTLSDRITPCGSPGAKQPPICWNGSPFQPIPVAHDVSSGVALSILENSEQFPGVSADLEAIRQYPMPYKANAVHILGYVGKVNQAELDASAGTANPLSQDDQVGKAGLESQYDQYLRGVDGVRTVAIDRAGNVTGTVADTLPTPGDNLVTHIDARVQATLELQLQQAVDRARSQPDPKGNGHYKADSAAGVVLDVRTGAIVAMASLPDYNPSVWVGGISVKEYAQLTASGSGDPLLSRAYQGGFAPGSTFKVVSSSAMLQSGRFSEAAPANKSSYTCPSFFKVGNLPFFNAENIGHGSLSLTRAVEVSCDTVFYQAAFSEWLRDGGLTLKGKPADIFINEALGWGFGKKTGIDLPDEASSVVLTRADVTAQYALLRPQYCAHALTGYPLVAKTDPVRAALLKAYAVDNCKTGGQYKGGDAVNFVIGQGTTLTTPLKMAQIYAAIANGGTLWTPQIAKAVLGPDGKVVKVFAPVAQGHLPISRSTLAFLQNALVGVTTSGTSQVQFANFPLAQVPVATKTGTAEVVGKQTTSWFTTYAPANAHPQYAIVMMVSQGGFGSTTSADSVRAVYEKLFGIVGHNPPNPKLSILPGGVLPTKLPVIAADGTILPPGSVRPPASAAGSTGGVGAVGSDPAPLTPPGLPTTPPMAAAVVGPAFATDRARQRGGGP
jgi:penicillin-binding protein 2